MGEGGGPLRADDAVGLLVEDEEEVDLLAEAAARQLAGGHDRDDSAPLTDWLNNSSNVPLVPTRSDSAGEDGDPEAATPMPATEPAKGSPQRGIFMPYFRLVMRNREYRAIFFGNVFAELGNWFNYVATISVLQGLTGSALAVVYYTLMQTLPSLVFGPFIGLLVDRFDRQSVMIFTSICRACIVPGLIFCRTVETVPLIYALIFAKSFFWSIYLPARSSIVPSLVARDDLLLANGLDGIVWSSMIFIGAAFGGFITSLLGVTTAYILDALCYVLGAYFFLMLSQPGAFGPFVATVRAVQRAIDWVRARLAGRPVGGTTYTPMDAAAEAGDESDSDGTAGDATGGSAVTDKPPAEPNPNTSAAASQIGKPDASSFRQLVAAYREGMRYVASYPYLLAIVFFKGSMWLFMGMVDMMNIRFAQTIFVIGENGTISFAITYMVVGAGTLLTPMLARKFGRDTPAGTQLVLVVGLVQLTLGTLCLALSTNFYLFLAANLVRSGGTSISLVYSSLVLQKTLPSAVRGRVFSLEFTITQLFSCSSKVFAGYAADIFGWSVYYIDSIAFVIAVVNLLWWTLFFRLSRRARDAAYAANSPPVADLT